MKKYYIILLSAVLAFAACNKENTVPDISEKYPVFSSVMEGLGTRTEFGENYSVVWTADDCVAVFNGTTQLLQYKVAAGGSTSTELEPVGPAGAEGSAISRNVAFYPYSASVSCSEEGGRFTISTSMPQIQNYKSSSFGVGAAPMMAIASAEAPAQFRFKNVFSCLKLQFTGTGKVRSITVNGNNDEYMSGDIAVSMTEEGTPEYAFGPAAGKSVTLDCADGIALSDTPTPFYIAVPCQQYAKGITVSVEMADAFANPEITPGGDFTIARSAVRPMAAFNLVGIATEQMAESGFTIKFCNSCYAYSAINAANGNASGVERKQGEENEYSTKYSLYGSTREYTHSGDFYGGMGGHSPKLLLRGTGSGWTSLHGSAGTLVQPAADCKESGFDDYDYTYPDFHSFGGRRRQVALVVDLGESCNVASIGLVNWTRNASSDGRPLGHLKGVEFYVSDDAEFTFTPAYGAYRTDYDYSNYANPSENSWTLIAREDNLPVSTGPDDTEWVDVPYSVLVSGKAKGRFLKIRFLTNTALDGATGYSARELYVKKATNLD